MRFSKTKGVLTVKKRGDASRGDTGSERSEQ